MSQASRWIVVHLCLPALPAAMEFGSKMLFSAFTYPIGDAIPYVTLLVLVMAVAIFVHDELGRHVIPDPDEAEEEVLKIARESLIWFFAFSAIELVLSIAFEMLSEYKSLQEFDLCLWLIRGAIFVTIALFCFSVVGLQGRYKLRVPI